MQKHSNKCYSRRHTATSGMGQKIIFFSEINHVEDQNGVYSTLKVHMSKIHPTRSN